MTSCGGLSVFILLSSGENSGERAAVSPVLPLTTVTERVNRIWNPRLEVTFSAIAQPARKLVTYLPEPMLSYSYGFDIIGIHPSNRMESMSGADGATEQVIEMRLPSRLGYERIAMDTAASLARRMGFAPDRIDALRTAIGEAVTNAIEHGNQADAAMKVVVILTVRTDELIISVADQGRKVLDPAQTFLQPRITDAFQRADKGGWGIWLIRELMDEVEFSFAPGSGNQVRMVVHLERPPVIKP
jgi:serine/threonine-protein kinase RsbW